MSVIEKVFFVRPEGPVIVLDADNKPSTKEPVVGEKVDALYANGQIIAVRLHPTRG